MVVVRDGIAAERSELAVHKPTATEEVFSRSGAAAQRDSNVAPLRRCVRLLFQDPR